MDRKYSQSVIRFLLILGRFTPQQPELGIADIADDLKMSRSTTHRYVVTLVEVGCLRQVRNRKYRLAPGVAELGLALLNATGLKDHAQPWMQEVRQKTEYTLSLGTLDDSAVFCEARVCSYARDMTGVNDALYVGAHAPAHATALGKVLLAFQDGDQDENLKVIKLPAKRTPNTIKNRSHLKQELDLVRSRKVAFENEENAEGVVAIAVPILDENGQVRAALSLEAPASIISAEGLYDGWFAVLKVAADEISRHLSYRRDDEKLRAAA